MTLKSSRTYKGIDRRATSERRGGVDRRNLIRDESAGNDRRVMPCRRKEDVFWLKHK